MARSARNLHRANNCDLRRIMRISFRFRHRSQAKCCTGPPQHLVALFERLLWKSLRALLLKNANVSGLAGRVLLRSRAAPPHVVTFLKKFTSCAWKFGFPADSQKVCAMMKARSGNAASRGNIPNASAVPARNWTVLAAGIMRGVK